MTSSVFKGTLRQWMGSECAAHVKEKRQLVVIGYNTGLGSGELSLMASWLPDLIALIKAGLPAAFTCANEAADLFGETRVMGKLLKARFVVEPYKNKWHAVTTYRCEGEQGEKEYTCANSFVYAVCGTADSSATASARLENAGYAEAALRVRSCVPFPRATLTPAIFCVLYLTCLPPLDPTFPHTLLSFYHSRCRLLVASQRRSNSKFLLRTINHLANNLPIHIIEIFESSAVVAAPLFETGHLEATREPFDANAWNVVRRGSL